jgi:Ca-activated chloride channel family protein
MTRVARLLVSVMLVLAGAGIASTALAADRTIVILDASGSMWGQIDGKPKLEIAREALRGVLSALPADREIGFMAYGHREKGSCEDIELIVPPAAGTAGAISAAADSMKFLGKTPLSAAVKKAAEELKYTEDKATVVLITDGLETCKADPCALGTELEQSGVDFTAHVVGFGLTAEEGKQVACLAENTGGKYIQAKDEEALKEALAQTVAAPPPAAEPAPAPEPEPAPAPEPAKVEFNFEPSTVFAQGQEPIKDGANVYEVYSIAADGAKGERVTTEYANYRGNLEPGDYIVRAIYDGAAVEQKVTIAADTTAKPLFVLNAGTLVLSPRPAPGAEIDSGAAIRIDYPGGSTTYYGKTKYVVPAGDTKLTATIGQGTLEETVTVAAGQVVEKDLIVAVGHATVNAYYTAGGEKVDASGLFTQIVKATKKIDGTREELTNNYGPDAKFDLPAGDYVAIAKMDQAEAEQAFIVKAGAPVEVSVTLEAGVLAITAPGASFIEVLSEKKNIQGDRKGFGNAYADTYQTTLPAGDYVVVATRGDPEVKAEAKASVHAGERSEVTVP